MSPFGRLIRLIGRQGSVYLAASGVVAAVGMIQVAALTRLLSGSEFGQLAVLTVFSASLTLLLNLGSLQGSFRSVFGSVGEDAIDEEDESHQPTGDSRAALGNALALTATLGLVGATIVAACSHQIAELLLGDGDMATAVTLAGVAGAFGAVWRLAVNVPRLERRAGAYAVGHGGRAVLVMSGATLLVALGGSVEDAIAGMAAGTGVGLALALFTIRHSARPSFAPRDWLRIFALGAPIVPVVAAQWAMQNGDLFILSAYASDAEVGVYRAGSRIGAFVAYFTSALLMAWGPLTREPLHAAVDARHGRSQAGAQLATGFLAGCLWLLLAVSLFSPDLVRIAGPSFASAADVIPVVAGGLILHACFVVLYRIAQIRSKRRTFVTLSLTGAAVFVGSAFALVPRYGGVGAASAVLTGYAFCLVGMLVLSQRGEQPLPLSGRRLALICVLFAATLAVGLAAGDLATPARIAVALLAVTVYPVALVMTGVVPRSAIPRLLARQPAHDDVTALGQLEPSDFELVRAAAIADRSPKRFERLTRGDDGPAALERLVGALRTVAATGSAHPADAEIGRYLLAPTATAERDRAARRLWSSHGADPLELDALATCLTRLRKLSSADWEYARERTSARHGDSLAATRFEQPI
jgi:O-antigen/teichoic acid export membrane protein